MKMKMKNKTHIYDTILLKKTPLQVLSCEMCEIFKCTFFEEYLTTTVSASCDNTTPDIPRLQEEMLP